MLTLVHFRAPAGAIDAPADAIDSWIIADDEAGVFRQLEESMLGETGAILSARQRLAERLVGQESWNPGRYDLGDGFVLLVGSPVTIAIHHR